MNDIFDENINKIIDNEFMNKGVSELVKGGAECLQDRFELVDPNNVLTPEVIELNGKKCREIVE